MQTIELNNADHAWDFLIKYDIATKNELTLVTGIMGYNWDTCMEVLQWKTGYQDIEQYIDNEIHI